MAVESKPLFHPEVLRQQVRAFQLPERAAAAMQPRLNHWAELIASGRADTFKEPAPPRMPIPSPSRSRCPSSIPVESSDGTPRPT